MSRIYHDLLVMSDSHNPYEHPDTVPFYQEVKRKYKPDGVVHVGDEVDQHAMSFHDSDPDLPSAGDELELAIKSLQPIYRLFPEVMLVDSNHGSMVYRKGKHHGIARKYLRDYGDILEAPPGWTWQNKLLLQVPGNLVYVCHGIRKNGLRLAEKMGCHVVQGHYHTEFNVQYTSSPANLLWSMQVGCTIDDEAVAFHYNKTTDLRPIIGCGIVINGLPKLLPMVLDVDGKWTGEVP